MYDSFPLVNCTIQIAKGYRFRNSFLSLNQIICNFLTQNSRIGSLGLFPFTEMGNLVLK